MKLYIIRHGETQWNTQKKLQGWKNSPLTDNGIEAAKKLRERLEEENINLDKIYSSDLKRASDTAKIIKNGRDIEHIELEELKEISYGIWEGMTVDEIKDKYKDQYETYIYKTDKFSPAEGGETLEAVEERVALAMDKILDSGGENILVVSHGVTIKVLIAMIEDIALEDYYKIPIFKGTALTILEYRDGEFKFIKKACEKHIK